MTKSNAVKDAPLPSASWKTSANVAALTILFTFGALGGWAAYARLDGGAVATGVVAVESYKRTVQHLEGGIVKDLLVREGDFVREGEVLIRLDETRPVASKALHEQQLVLALAQEARLVAERDMAETVLFPEELAAERLPGSQEAMSDQIREFEARRATFLTQRGIFAAQIEQIEKEIEAIGVERQTAAEQLEFVKRDLEGVRSLRDKKLVENARVTELELELLKLKGAISRSEVDRVRALQRVEETRMKREQLEDEYRQEAARQLPELRKVMGDLRQQIIVAEDTLKRVELLAPIAGTVQQLRIFTVGGVIRAGEPILDIVPKSDQLVVRARVSPLDADRVFADMIAEVRFPSFATQNLPTVTGTVKNVSRDRLVDEATGDPYFAAEVEVDRESLPDDIERILVAGLPADVIFPTGERTALQYLVSPITERLSRAMREK